jgi:hypothetical protein
MCEAGVDGQRIRVRTNRCSTFFTLFIHFLLNYFTHPTDRTFPHRHTACTCRLEVLSVDSIGDAECYQPIGRLQNVLIIVEKLDKGKPIPAGRIPLSKIS